MSGVAKNTCYPFRRPRFISYHLHGSSPSVTPVPRDLTSMDPGTYLVCINSHMQINTDRHKFKKNMSSANPSSFWDECDFFSPKS